MRRAAGAVALGAALTAAAATFGLAALYVAGIALAALGAGAAAWVLPAARARLDRELGPATVQEEQAWPVRLRVRTAALPLPAGELVEPLLGRAVPLARRPGPVRVDVRFSRRGRRRIEPARLIVRDPLGLAVREIPSSPGEVLVLPRLEPVLARRERGLGGEMRSAAGRHRVEGAEVELDSLRPYRPGAPASRIHWATVARTGEVMERRLVADAGDRPLVVLDPRNPASDEALDRAVRAVASLCVHLARGGGCGLLLPGDRRPAEVDAELRAWSPLHARLALVEPGGGAPAVGRHERSAIFWVTAAVARPDASLPRGLRHAAARERFLVTAAGRGGAGAEFTVAGCAGRRVGGARRRAAA